MTCAISVENLSKAYLIGLVDKVPDSLVTAIGGMLKAPWKNWKQLRRLNTYQNLEDADDIYWALKEVSFEVQEGEVLGVIGKNGAGKSTLLKILSRITEPTRGRAVIHGRVSSLLEVGTGFHPELSGRENVYLNGTILGMTKREIDLKFDEIVDFSGVEKFLDTPIKRYSSGMKVRLAFAVAAHLEPEILIIDEVLAVGDAEFQKKCVGKMKDVAKGGRTVLFVSHNLDAVESLCTRAILLKQARLEADGTVESVLDTYLQDATLGNQSRFDLTKHPFRWNTAVPILQSVAFLDDQRNVITEIRTGDRLIVQFSVCPPYRLESPQFGIGFNDHIGRRVFSVATYLSSSELSPMEGSQSVYCELAELPLVAGTYTLSLSVGDGANRLLDAIDDAISIKVRSSDYLGSGWTAPHTFGSVAVRSAWTST